MLKYPWSPDNIQLKIILKTEQDAKISINQKLQKHPAQADLSNTDTPSC